MGVFTSPSKCFSVASEPSIPGIFNDPSQHFPVVFEPQILDVFDNLLWRFLAALKPSVRGVLPILHGISEQQIPGVFTDPLQRFLICI